VSTTAIFFQSEQRPYASSNALYVLPLPLGPCNAILILALLRDAISNFIVLCFELMK
jgi:hypothetical protein